MSGGAVGRIFGLGAFSALFMWGCGPPAPPKPTWADSVKVTVRAQDEVAVEGAGDAGEVRPVLHLPRSTVAWCLEAPASLGLGPGGLRALAKLDGTLGETAPLERLGDALCSTSEHGDLAPGRRSLCIHLEDPATGHPLASPCVDLELAPTPQALEGWRGELRRAVGAAQRGDIGLLDLAAEQARSLGLPGNAARAELIAVHFLSVRGGDGPRRARRRLDALPPWLGSPGVGALGAQAAYQRAQVHHLLGDVAATWRWLDVAAAAYRRQADPQAVAVTWLRAEVLSAAGAHRRALDALRRELDACETLRCHDDLWDAVRLQLVRLELVHPLAGPEEWRSAEALLDVSRRRGGDDPRRRSLRGLLGAMLDLRLGRPAGASLDAARAAIADLEPGGEGASMAGWADWLSALDSLDRGDSGSARTLCAPHVDSSDPSLAAWSHSCLGRALRAAGELGSAALAFDKAIALHRHRAQGSGVALALAGSSGPQTEDVARAARVAVDSDRPDRAWGLLETLDRQIADEGRRRRCRAQASGETLAEWEALDDQIERRLATLEALDFPVARSREAELEELRDRLEDDLTALWRQWPGCAGEPDPGGEASNGVPDLRAFFADDELILLGRSGVLRRTPMSRASLLERVAHLRRWVRLDPAPPDGDWRRQLEPLSRALAPPAGAPPVLAYALHGPLQAIPLAALPSPVGKGWLGDRSVFLIAPAQAPGGESQTRGDGGAAVAVLDPRGDLAGSRRLGPVLRDLFPDLTVLEGPAATWETLRAAPAPRWLHLGAHGSGGPGAPELASVGLADRTVRAIELTSLPPPREFANLSACHTGAAGLSADSGRFGLGGLLVRLGVPYVIASRGDLPDPLAEDFNRGFYRRIAAGAGVPEAYGDALREVSVRHPASAWAQLMLLTGPSSPAASAKKGRGRGISEGAHSR
ncbi:MAG: CHAT domain-containing protein [Acidobacteriota bacterium]